VRSREAGRPAIVPTWARADTEIVGKAADVAVHITIEDHDDRPERMVRDPARYFADARQRAVRELMHQAGWLFPERRHRKSH
jgi:uncharacterized protein YggE